MLIGFAALILVAVLAYRDAPPIPDKVVSTFGEILLTGQDFMAGQELFLTYGLMENGTIWGHGAYLGPDFAADYLHTLGVDTAEAHAQKLFGRRMDQLTRGKQGTVEDGSSAPLETESLRPDEQNTGLHGSGPSIS
jgi:nitric oxide reductase subunit B